MSGVLLLLWWARLRRSPRQVVALVVLTAVGGGIALCAAAGARRTTGAYAEVVAQTNSAELGSSYVPQDLDELSGRIAAIGAVEDFTQVVGFLTILLESPVPALSSFAINNDPVVVERPLVLDGRLPRAADEVFVNEAAAAGAGVSVGERLEVMLANFEFTEFVPVTLDVVGIGLLSDEVYQDETGAKPAFIYAKDFVAAHEELIVWGAVSVKLVPGTDLDAAAAEMLDHGFVIDNDSRTDRDRAAAAIRPLAVTLWALALLAGLATTVVIGQGVSRLVQRSPGEARSLAAVGSGRAILLAVDLGVAATVGAAGTVGALVVAVLGSPLFPLGRSRRIAGLRGFDVDVVTLGTGVALLLLALAAVVTAASLRRRRGGEPRPGRAPGLLGATPAIGTGVRFATGRRGLTGTIAGVAVALAAIAAAATFTGSMQDLVSRPELAGFNWDLMGRNSYAVIDTAAVADRLGDEDAVERITGLTFADATVDGIPVPASVWAEIDGSRWPSLSGGRAPERPHEVLASQQTLDDLGYEIGDTITVEFAGGDNNQGATSTFELDVTIVGTAVSPAIGIAGTDTPRLDEGILVRQDDIAGRGFEYGSAVLFDLADGADTDVVESRFPDGLPDDLNGLTDWFVTAEPAEVIQSGDAIDVLLLAIVSLLVGIMAMVMHNLLVFVRQRRSAFAVLKALGFTPRQIRSTVLWQSALVVGAALVVALPVGITAGRWLYHGFADGIGVIVEPVVPLLALSAVVLAAVALVQVVALVPARQARRTDAATELRWE